MIDWNVKGKASVLVDGQFGSTGKGLIAAWLAQQSESPSIATCNSGAQAGHTTRYADGRSFICYHLPTTAVVKGCTAYVNAGSIIDIEQFHKELIDCGVDPDRVFVDPRAAVIEPDDRAAERAGGSATEKTASTQKGVGHALSRKIMRKAHLAMHYSSELKPNVAKLNLNARLAVGGSVIVEVPQGLDLSLNHGLAYPYTTSRDCTVMAGISDAGIHPTFVGPIAMVMRTYPIRVGDLYNELGEKLGGSGPFYPDSHELNWAEDFPGIEPERTTVTKRVRRIATWSQQQYIRGLELNRPTIVALNFCNYLSGANHLFMYLQYMKEAHEISGIKPKLIFGFGPNVEDVTDNADQAMAWYERRTWECPTTCP